MEQNRIERRKEKEAAKFVDRIFYLFITVSLLTLCLGMLGVLDYLYGEKDDLISDETSSKSTVEVVEIERIQ